MQGATRVAKTSTWRCLTHHVAKTIRLQEDGRSEVAVSLGAGAGGCHLLLMDAPCPTHQGDIYFSAAIGRKVICACHIEEVPHGG